MSHQRIKKNTFSLEKHKKERIKAVQLGEGQLLLLQYDYHFYPCPNAWAFSVVLLITS